MNSITVYLKPERSTVVNTSKVKLEDVVKIYCGHYAQEYNRFENF